MKTIEEAARHENKILAERYFSSSEEFIDGFKKGVEYATKWIPIEDELPKEFIQVLVIDEGNCITTGWLEPKDIIGYVWELDVNTIDSSAITH